MSATAARQEIARIDRESDAITSDLESREKISPLSAASWQRAWDRHPELRQRYDALSRQRGEAQVIRDEAEHKAAMAAARTARAAGRKRYRLERESRCPTCGR